MFTKKKETVILPTLEDIIHVTKPETQIDMESIYKNKLIEISNGYSIEDAEIVCAVFARKFPDAMYTALSNEHKNMVTLLTGVDQLHLSYMEKLGKV